jgi:sRNA-binding regulator protein Hfq
MSSDSMIYTIGTALNRARDNGFSVEILVEGQWVSGDVLAVDGFGVVLQAEDNRHSVIRIESISAVTICAAAPHRPAIDRVHAMPAGPHTAAS